MAVKHGVLRVGREVLFGAGMASGVGAVVVRYGKRALVCTDQQIASTAGGVTVCASLDRKMERSEVFDRGVPEVPLSSVIEAVEVGRRLQADVVVGVGGGSSIDLAKLTRRLLTPGGSLGP